MKFGKTLLSNQIPEWSRNYIAYKSLKKDIKNASNEHPPSEEIITSLFFKLDRELEKVDTFYVYKQSFIRRRLRLLEENYEKYHDDNDELLQALAEIKTQMDRLLWFSEMNSKGFRKILKKLDKRLSLETQSVYWETKVAMVSFAGSSELREELSRVNQWISSINSTVNREEQVLYNSNNSYTLKLARFRLKNENIAKSIREDNKHELESLLKQDPKVDTTMLELAVEHGAVDCLTYLVETAKLPLSKDINERNILHRTCIRSPTAVNVIECLLKIDPSLALEKDFVGRRPLHYAVESNNKTLTSLLLQHAITNQYIDDKEWQDRDGYTPLFYGILHQSTQAVKTLIEVGNIHEIDTPDAQLHHPSSVALACKLKNLELLQLLISKGASVNITDENGETPLIFAIQNHFLDGVKTLISHADINAAENDNGWTPLMVACIEGFQDIVQVLLDAGADRNARDHNKWTASEHAVFRGYLDIGRLVSSDNPTSYINPEPKTSTSTKSKASRLYGHKYLTDISTIIITLGSNDTRNPLCHQFIELSKSLGGRLSLSVTATNATGEFPIIDLPTDFTQPFYPDPIVLFAAEPEKVVIRFDLIETLESTVLARGTLILAGDFIFSKSKGFKGPTEKASLRGQQTVPLVKAKDLECVGTLGMEYFVVTPFQHENMKIGDRYTYYKSLSTQVIGHRGSGMNKKGSKLQVGENTVLSFVTAASLGAEYVEFDVQLTKDLVPVIYHDWTVTETGYDIPLNSITLEQFLNLRSSGHIKEYHTGVSDGIHGVVVPVSKEKKRLSIGKPIDIEKPKDKKRSHSFSSPTRPPTNILFDQTRTSKSGKIKGNGPETIQGPFTTLAETLKSVPGSVGFNIEVKYPMIDEAEQDELTQFQELNIFVDTILECVYNNVEQDRHVIFSSFHPEICLALNLKQPNYPVFFLTDAGTLPMADVRCNSLQGATRFAKQADLLGIVTASEPILEAPRLVQVIKEMGLLLFTYGVLNNEVENAIAQKNYGVDAVIVDSVLPIRKGLRGDS